MPNHQINGKGSTIAGVSFYQGFSLSSCNCIKKRFQHCYFRLNFTKMLKKTLLKEHLQTTAFTLLVNSWYMVLKTQALSIKLYVIVSAFKRFQTIQG